MFSKGIGQEVAKTLSKAKFWASGHAPELCLAAGVVSFGATIYFTAKGAVKSNNARQEYSVMKRATDDALSMDLEPEQYDIVDKELKDAKKKFVVDNVKAWSPVAVCGITSLSFFTGNHIILKRRNALLVAAYKVLDGGFKNYRANVIEELGEDADFRFRSSAKTHTITTNEVGEDGKKHKKKEQVTIVEDDPSGYQFIYDDRHSMMNVSSAVIARDNLMMAEKSANVLLQSRGYIMLNEVLRSLGLHETSAGQIVGWQTKGNGDGEVRFNPVQIRTAFDDDGVAFLLDFNVDGPIWSDIDKYTRLWGED